MPPAIDDSATNVTQPDGVGDRTAVHRFAGWSALVSAGTTALGFVAFAAFLAVGPPFATVADASGVILGLSVIPVAWGLHRLYRRLSIRRSQVVSAIGVLGGMIVTISSLGLVIGPSGSGVSALQLEVAGTIGSGVLGVWLLGVGSLDLDGSVLGRRLTVIGVAAGVGYVLLTVGFLLFSPEHPITAVGGLVAVAAYTVWAAGLGRRFLLGGELGP